MFVNRDPQPASGPAANQSQSPRTTPDQTVVANLLMLAKVLQELQPELERATNANVKITEIDCDVLATSIRRCDQFGLLADSKPLIDGHMYVGLPSAAYGSLDFNLTFHNSNPVKFFVREVALPQSAKFYSMSVTLNEDPAPRLMFAVINNPSMQDSSDWTRASAIVDELRRDAASLADKLNRPDLSQKLR